MPIMIMMPGVVEWQEWSKSLKEEAVACVVSEEAGRYATAPYPDVTYWEQNWRKGGLSERRIAIIKEYNFYNQQYCGCEFSMRKEEKGG